MSGHSDKTRLTAEKEYPPMIRFSPNPNRAHLVRWHEWSDDAFGLARDQDKPVMLFLTAFWCRFCQRMDEGAFSDAENMALLNAYFISVRADYAQRPDVDVRYNRNGWPTIAFMTPEGDLLAVTNYLPSSDFGDLLVRVYRAYHEKKSEIRALREKIRQDNAPARQAPAGIFPVAGSTEIAGAIMTMADREYGGYGRGQKFIQPHVNEFLLGRYEITGQRQYLDHVRLTLERMREGPMRDRDAGGYFRTCSGRDWSGPHREKLLGEQVGLIANCLHALRLSQTPAYARMAVEIIDYLNCNLFDAATGAFYGCEDFLRRENRNRTQREEFFTILDGCVYVDANAQAVVAFLEAGAVLANAGYRERALLTLEFLWECCRDPGGGMFHYFDGAPRLSGLLEDQVSVGRALLKAHAITAEKKHLERAGALARYIQKRLRNSQGGYYDILAPGPALTYFRLTLVGQNGAAASFFLALAEATGDRSYREAAHWALAAFPGKLAPYGLDAACFGRALDEYTRAPADMPASLGPKQAKD